MIYLDSNVFIYPVLANEETESKARLSKRILIEVAEGGTEAATSLLTWDELVWSVKKVIGTGVAKTEGEKFLRFSNLKLLNVNHEVMVEAQKIIGKYNLNPRDAIHAACAIKNNVKEIVTDDPDFDKVTELKRIRLEKFAFKKNF